MDLTQIFSHWKQIRAGLLETIDKFSDDELSYTPFRTSWSVGQTMLHIADAEEGWFRFAVTRQLEKWPEYFNLENYPTRESIKSALAEVHTRTEQFLESKKETDLTQVVRVPWGDSFPLLWIVWHVVEHEIHHRGELSLILGLLGRDGLDV
ncbi:MAG: DinB family protein [Chloroflexota bacterium]